MFRLKTNAWRPPPVIKVLSIRWSLLKEREISPFVEMVPFLCACVAPYSCQRTLFCSKKLLASSGGGLIICLVLQLALCNGTYNCPHVENCECIGTSVKCINIDSEMPVGLPKDVTKMTLINLNLQSLPLGYFNQFKDLMQLYIKSANINVIKSCTFQGFNIQSFTLREALIDEIEGYAFSNVRNVTVFSLYKSKIKKIHEYAFYDFNNVTRFDFTRVVVTTELPTHAFFSFHNIKHLEIRDSTFASINTLALNEMSGLRLKFYNNSFTTLACQNNESLAVIFDQVEIFKNKMWCDCAISWLIRIPLNQRLSMLKYLNLMVPKTSVQNNLCLGPQALINYTLGRLTFEQLNCPKPEIAQDCPSLKNLGIDPPFSTCKGASSIVYSRPKGIKDPPTHFKDWKNNTSANKQITNVFLITLLLLLLLTFEGY